MASATPRARATVPTLLVRSVLLVLLVLPLLVGGGVLAVLTTMPTTGPVAAARAATAEPSSSADFPTEPPRFAWPLAAPSSPVRPFDRPPSPYAAGHRGIDLAAAPGQQVLASADGLVVFAGSVAGRGVVSIDHDAGLRTTYEPLRWSVSAGERVHRGQVIGTVVAGHLGCPAQACLHWGVRRGDDYLDPLRLVMPQGTLRLKPWIGSTAPS